jgi:hypothetical protein
MNTRFVRTLRSFLQMPALRVFALALTVSAASAQITPPQGRLSLSWGAPVMTADVVGFDYVYYVPYVGNSVPIYNGSTWSSYTITGGPPQLILGLNSAYQTAGNIYDIYAFLDSGTLTIGAASVGWTSTATRPDGPANYQGIEVNGSPAGISLYNAGTLYSSIAQFEATYLGSVYMTGNGVTTMQFTPAAASGGSGTILGLWNAYNRVRVTASSVDSHSSWTYSSSTWRDADNSANNSITWLDGLGHTSISAAYDATANLSASTGSLNVGVGINAITTPAINGQISGTTALLTVHAATLSPPITGLNVAQAIERVTSGTATFYGVDLLTLETEY